MTGNNDCEIEPGNLLIYPSEQKKKYRWRQIVWTGFYNFISPSGCPNDLIV